MNWKSGERKNQIRQLVNSQSFHSYSNAGWRAGKTFSKLGKKYAYFYKTISKEEIARQNKKKEPYIQKNKTRWDKQKAVKYHQNQIDTQRKFRKKINRKW